MSPNCEETLYRTLFDVAGDAIIVFSAEGVSVDCNQAAIDLFASTRAQMIGSSPTDWSPEFQPNGRRSDEMAAEFLARARAGEKVRFEWESRRADGVPFPVDSTVSRARIDDRVLLVIVTRDISEFKRLEKDLRHSEEKFSRVFHGDPDAMLITEIRSGQIRDMNSSFTANFGYTADESLGRTTREIGLWTGDAGREAAVSLMNRQGFLRNFEVEQRTKDGRVLTILASATRLEIDRSSYWLVHLHDISERKRAEVALLESKDRFRKVVEQSPLSMALISMDGTIDYINRKAVETFGYLPQDIPDMDRWWSQAHPDETYRTEVIAQWMDLVAEALAHNHEIEQREYRVTCKNGNVKTVVIFGVWVTDQVLVIFQDVTERKQDELKRIQAEKDMRTALRQIEQKERSKSRFLAATGHDLRQPLYAAQLFLDNLISTQLDRRQLANAKRIHEALKAMSGQLQLLLDLSRLEDANIHVSKNDISSIDLFQGMVDIYGQIAREANVRLLFHAGEFVLHTDNIMLSRLLGNLIDNAIKFSPQGTVLVCVRRSKGGQTIQVRDNGQGIPDIQHGAIFDDFYQIGNSARDPTAGYGLGLSIVSRIAHLLGISIQLASSVGKGSTFSVFIPHRDT